MIFPFLKQKINDALGIDIGTYSIKVVHLERKDEDNIILKNYSELKSQSLFQNIPGSQASYKAKFSTKKTIEGIKTMMKEAEISCKHVVFAIPDFDTFLNYFTLPSTINQNELSQIIPFEIQKYIPMPYSEFDVNWSILANEKKDEPLIKIFFAAIPKEVNNKYKEIGQEIGFKTIELETEIFSLVRALSLIENLKELIVLIDIGVQTTTINIIEKGELKISYSFNISSFEIDQLLVSSLKINLHQAEAFKKEYGIIPHPPLTKGSNKNIKNIILPLVNLILEKYKQTVNSFLNNQPNKIQQIYLTGGSASLPGLVEYFFYISKTPTNILNPFENIIINDNKARIYLKKIGSSFVVALGAALKKVQKEK